MCIFGFIFISFVVGRSCALPVGYGLFSNSPFDYYNGFNQPCIGDLCRSPVSISGGVYPSNLLAGVLGGDVLSGVPLDVGINYPYGSPRTVNFAQENYVRGYGYGPSEVGVRDQVSLRSNIPGIIPTYSRVGGVLGGDVLSGVPLDLADNYPYGSPRTVNFAKGNYVRDYGYGQAEVGIRDQVSVRSNVPGIGIVPPYSRVCSYLPIGSCLRRVNRYPALPVEYDVPY